MSKTSILQFWDSDTPEYITKLLKTVESNNPEFGYALFNDQQAIAYINEHYGSDMSAVYESCALPSMRADLFRYFFLLREGGFYIDADFGCLRSLTPLVAQDGAGCLYNHNTGITNSMLFIRDAENPLIARVLQDAISNIKKKKSNSVWGVTGPGVFQRLHADNKCAELFTDLNIINDDVFFNYFRAVPGLEYKSEDKHWTVARNKGISIFN